MRKFASFACCKALSEVYYDTFGKIHTLVLPVMIHIPLLLLMVFIESDHRSRAREEELEASDRLKARIYSVLVTAAGSFINFLLAVMLHRCTKQDENERCCRHENYCKYFNQAKFYAGAIGAMIFLHLTTKEYVPDDAGTYIAAFLIGFLRAAGNLMVLRMPGDEHFDQPRKFLAVETLMSASELLIGVEIPLTVTIYTIVMLLFSMIMTFGYDSCYNFENHAKCKGIKYFSIEKHHYWIGFYLLMKSIAVASVSILVGFTAFSLFQKLSTNELREDAIKELVFISPSYIQILTLVFNLAFVHALDWMTDTKYFNVVQFGSLTAACLLMAMVHQFGDNNLNYQLWFYNLATIFAPLLTVLINSYMGVFIEQHFDIATSINMTITNIISACMLGLIGYFSNEDNIVWFIGGSFALGALVQFGRWMSLDKFKKAEEKEDKECKDGYLEGKKDTTGGTGKVTDVSDEKLLLSSSPI